MLLLLILLSVLAVAAAGVSVGVDSLRSGSVNAIWELSDKERYRRITQYFILGIVAPWPVCWGLYQWLFYLKRSYAAAPPGMLLLIPGTVATAAGLPFVIKMIRLFRRDSSAHAASWFFSAYGLILWTGFNLLLMLLFMKGCC